MKRVFKPIIIDGLYLSRASIIYWGSLGFIIKTLAQPQANTAKAFTENAKIFQVYEGTIGMEIYNKWEFINKLTLPASGLKDIEILDTEYSGEKIMHLRFKQNGTE